MRTAARHYMWHASFHREKKEGASMGDTNPKKAPKQKKTAGKPSVAPVIKAEPEVVKKAKPTK